MPTTLVVRGLIAAIALVCACSEPREEGPPPAASVTEPPTTRSLSALFGGCLEVRAGSTPTCVFDPTSAKLRLWVPVDPGFTTHLAFDDTPDDTAADPVDGGLRFVLRPPADARALTLRADLDGEVGVFTLALDPSPPRVVPELQAIKAEADRAVARQRLAALLPSLRDGDQAMGLMLAGDLAYKDNDVEAVIKAFGDAVPIAAKFGRLRDASTMAQRLVYACLALRPDETCARRWLDEDAAFAQVDPEQRPLHAYYEGLYKASVGDLAGALQAHHEGERYARALGLHSFEAAAVVEQMVLVGRVGAWERAEALHTRALALRPHVAKTTRVQLSNAIGWMLLEAKERRPESVDDPTPFFRDALAQIEGRHDAMSERIRATLQLHLAYAALLDGKGTQAQRWLDSMEDETLLHDEDRMWRQLLLARVALANGKHATASRRFSALLTEAKRRAEPELRWHALLGQGQVLEANRRMDAALRSYEEAERVLDQQLPRIAMGEGRARFVAERDRGTRRLVSLLLRLDRPNEALCAARLARTRALRAVARQLRAAASSPAQREELRRYRQTRTRLEQEWDESFGLPAASARQRQRQLSIERETNRAALDRLLGESNADAPPDARCEDLVDPPTSQLDLHFIKLDDGWVGFAVDDRGLQVEALGESESDGATLLRPFSAAIARAKSIRVMPSGALNQVPFHALRAPHAPDEMLIDLALVRYGLDLPVRRHARDEPTERRALIVAPPSNLASARAEVTAIDNALGTTGFVVRQLAGDAAVGDAVRQALPQVDLLHYVGHARADAIGGFSSALSLARDSTLDVGDVLTMSTAPTTVVLNGCETGRTDPQALAGGMSLAHAFVLAGAELVIATDREVEDASAAALMTAFYEGLAARRSAEASLQHALRSRRAQDKGWLHTRGWGP